MKPIRIFAFLALALSFAAINADAQKTRKPPATPKVVTSTTLPAANEVKTGSDKVSIQIKNVTKYIFVLGGAATGIETLDKDPRANQAARDSNAANKQKLMQTIRNLRAGLAALEVEFRTKPLLKKYLIQIQGITDLTAQSEDLAAAGRFSESGRPLLLVVEKLSDTLAAM
ncbi:MAG: hypothetical protein AB7V18_18045 [Pyrinomonadaceae bacterium]